MSTQSERPLLRYSILSCLLLPILTQHSGTSQKTRGTSKFEFTDGVFHTTSVVVPVSIRQKLSVFFSDTGWHIAGVQHRSDHTGG